MSGISGISIMGLTIGVLCIVTLVVFRQLLNGRRYLSALQTITGKGGYAHYRLVETNRPIACCVGYLKPEVYISRGLLVRLEPEHLKAVLAHEYAHAINYDNLRKLLVQWATMAWPKAIKKRIRKDFSNDAENNSDLAAALLDQQHNDLKAAIAIIERYCLNDLAQSKSDQRAKRFVELKKELVHCAYGAEYHRHKRLETIIIITALWLVILLGFGHFGHPLLEWLYQ
jgi:beta-lactamase regulating signal transducer with metallopeptidase domain